MKFANLVEGLNILIKYHDEEMEQYCSSEHDEIFFPGPSPEDMSELDFIKLDDLGFVYDEKYESWHVFS